MLRRQRKNIALINNEIDYEKLAKVIIEANRKKDDEPSTESDEKIGFWKGVWYIITNKKKTNGALTHGLFSNLLSDLFNILAVAGAIIALVVLGVTVYLIVQSVAQNDFLNCILFAFAGIIYSVLILLFCLLLRGVANEIKAEKDRNYIIALFSGVVSFAALVVSLIALLKGVG